MEFQEQSQCYLPPIDGKADADDKRMIRKILRGGGLAEY